MRFNRSSGVHIISSFFRGTYHKKRLQEILECLKRNLENPYVEALHVLWEDENPRTQLMQLLSDTSNSTLSAASDRGYSDKLVTSKVEKQPTYFRLFSYANSWPWIYRNCDKFRCLF
jgi:hypothetical protein